MTELAELQIRVQSLEAELADRRLNGLARSGDRAERATARLMSTMRSVAAPIAAAAVATAALVRHFAAEAKEIEILARVANSGTEEFQAIAFATEQVGVSAEKLADISKDVQDKLGDFIATGGGEFKDFFETVAPKVGLTAQALQGLSGPEVLVSVKKAMDDVNVSSAEQVFYLEAIANDASLLTPLLENNAEALKRQADEAFRLGGVLSKVDSTKLLEAAASSKKFDTALKGLGKRVAVELAPSVTRATDQITEAMVDLNDFIASGEASAAIDIFTGKFDGFGEDISGALIFLTEFFDKSAIAWGLSGKGSADFIQNAFVNMPENLRAVIKLMGVEILALVDYGDASVTALGEIIGTRLGAIEQRVRLFGRALRDGLNPFSDGSDELAEVQERVLRTRSAIERASNQASFDPSEIRRGQAARRIIDLNGQLNEQIKLRAELSARVERHAQLENFSAEATDEIFSRVLGKVETTTKARAESIKAILKENAVAIKSSDDQIGALEQLRAEYDKNREAKKRGITIGEPVPSGIGERTISEEEKKRLEREESAQKRSFAQLVESLRTDEEAINDSYDRRLAIILANTEKGSQSQSDLILRLETDVNNRLEDLYKRREETVEDTFTAMGAAAEQWGDDLADQLVRGELNFKTFATSILQEIARIQIKKATDGIVGQFTSGPNTPGSSGFIGPAQSGVGSIFGDIFGGFGDFFTGLGFANGGRPPVGRASIVGERGPELFVPDSAGTVVPIRNQAQGQSEVNLTISVSVTVPQSESDRAGDISDRVVDTIRHIVSDELINQLRDGNTLSPIRAR